MSWQKVRENIAEFVLLARAVSGYFDETLKSIVRQKVDRHFQANRLIREHRNPAILLLPIGKALRIMTGIQGAG